MARTLAGKPAPRKPTKTTPPAKPAKKPAAGKSAPAQHAPPKRKPAPTAKKATPRKTAPPKKDQKAPPKKAVKKAAKTPVKAPAPAPRPLTPRQQRFVDEYLIDLNITQAAIRAGYSAATAYAIGFNLLKKAEIVAAVDAGRQAQQNRTQITADRVVTELARIAFADTRDLVEVKKGACRHCHGKAHRYQRTESEYAHDRAEWIDEGNDPAEFEEAGGIGYTPLVPPHPDCLTCGGDGMTRTVLRDTRHLSADAAALYAGARQTKEGIEIKMHSKLDALEKLAKHLGIYEKDNQQKVDPLASLLHRIATGNGSTFGPVADDPERRTA